MVPKKVSGTGVRTTTGSRNLPSFPSTRMWTCHTVDGAHVAERDPHDVPPAIPWQHRCFGCLTLTFVRDLEFDPNAPENGTKRVGHLDHPLAGRFKGSGQFAHRHDHVMAHMPAGPVERPRCNQLDHVATAGQRVRERRLRRKARPRKPGGQSLSQTAACIAEGASRGLCAFRTRQCAERSPMDRPRLANRIRRRCRHCLGCKHHAHSPWYAQCTERTPARQGRDVEAHVARLSLTVSALPELTG